MQIATLIIRLINTIIWVQLFVDYNVCMKVVKIIQNDTGIVNMVVWRKA